MDSGGVKTFRDLLVWQKAMNLVTETYKMTRRFPKEEWYGLVQQIRRCAVSIPSNIAEGYGQKATNDYIRFLQISIGSLFELQTQLEIALNLEYIPKEAFDSLFESTREIERMMVSLINKIQKLK
jgi:four helix bundle protein